MKKLLFAFGAAAVVMLSMCSCEPAPKKKPEPVKKSSQSTPGGRFVNKTVEKLQLDNAKRNAEYEKAAL